MVGRSGAQRVMGTEGTVLDVLGTVSPRRPHLIGPGYSPTDTGLGRSPGT